MRLLTLDELGEPVLTEFTQDNIPPYAILSHTWGSEEVSFIDLIDKTGRPKAGYRKIMFCGRQAARDHLEYFWVDTCCIDKRDNNELTKAINSMFRWYRNAAKCYVYLSDVSVQDSDGKHQLSRLTWESDFRKSRWHFRGWTLQELIAPTEVEFFSLEGKRIGDKRSLEQQIHEITGVSLQALQGHSLHEFSVAERMAWAERRQTTEPEDGSYCLLGIFGVFMPLIYGEGKANALSRLRKVIRESEYEETHRVVMNTTQGPAKDDKLAEMLDWLSAPDPNSNYQKVLKQRLNGTGLWFLQCEHYARWKSGKSQFLWLHGIPGCGKSVLSTTILEDLCRPLEQPEDIIAYFYFDFNDSQKRIPELMMRSIISQLLRRCGTLPSALDVLFSSCDKGQQHASLDAYIEVLRQIILGFPRVYIVLDALDECGNRKELMSVLTTMAGWESETLSILFTSRKERDIEDALKSFMDEKDTINLQHEVVDQDIQLYIHERLSKDKGLEKWRKDGDIQKEIEKALMDGAHGMFRWAACQLDALEKCRNRVALRKSLKTLPPTLDKTYERILCSIQEEDVPYAIRILRWLAFSTTPLFIEEIAEIAAIDPDRNTAFDRDEIFEDPLEVVEVCSSLVTVTTVSSDEPNGKVDPNPKQCQALTLAHYSVQEYLTSDLCFQGPAARFGMAYNSCHSFIAKSCLSYLLQFDDPNYFSTHDIRDFPLARYSAESWIHHAQIAQDGDDLVQRTLTLMSRRNGAYLNWVRLHDLNTPRDGTNLSRDFQTIPEPLYYTSLAGLTEISRQLIERNGADVNAHSGIVGNALQAASIRGNEKIVEMLLAKGADVNPQGGFYGNSLQAASTQGHERIVEMLLAKGADVNAQGRVGGNSLQAASTQGHERIVEMLLAKGADVNAQGGVGGNSLQAASFQGHTKIIKMLLAKGGDVNIGGRYGNLVNRAALTGWTEIIRISFQANKSYQELRDGQGRGPLHLAARGGHIDAMDCLLAFGLDINAKDMRGDQVLSYAASGGFLLTVQKILGHPSLRIEESDGWSPLHWACRSASPAVFRQLIDSGFRQRIIRTSEPRALWSPYSIAVFHNNQNLVSYLGSRNDESSTIDDVLSDTPTNPDNEISRMVGTRCDNVTCDCCEHDIYGLRFNCLVCHDFDYCFMCKLTADKTHPGHEWMVIEP